MDANAHHGVYGHFNTPKLGMELFADIHRMDVTALSSTKMRSTSDWFADILIVFGCIADKPDPAGV